MKEKTPGRIGMFMRSDTVHTVLEALRSGGVSLIIERKQPWTKTMLYTEASSEDDAGYIRVNNGEVARTEVVKDGLHIDYDVDGDMVGIELVGFNLRRAKEKVVPQTNQGPKLKIASS